MFFLVLKILIAFLSNPFAKITSKNVLFISVAILLFILKLQATTPPNALIGSLAFAYLKEFRLDLLEQTPLGFACLIITDVGNFFSENSISKPA